MQATSVKSYKLLSKGWISEAEEADAKRYRAQHNFRLFDLKLQYMHTQNGKYVTGRH